MVVSLSAFKGFCDLWLFTSCNLAESAAMISRNVLNILNETGSQENETVCIFAYIFSDLSRFYRAATSPSCPTHECGNYENGRIHKELESKNNILN